MPQVQVFLAHQNPAVDTAKHRCSKNLAARLCEYYPHLLTYNCQLLVLHLKTKTTWGDLKAQLRNYLEGKPAQIQDSGMSLMLSYPPLPCETNGRERQRLLWTNATRF